MRKATQAAALALVLAGCLVKKSTYQKALDENARLEGELAASRQQQADTEKTLGDKIKELETQLGMLDETARTKESELGKIRDEKEATESELGKIRGQKEATESELGKVRGQKEATEKELAELRRQKEAAEKRIAQYKALQAKFRALVDTGKLQVVFRNGQMTLKLPSGILFPSGSAELSKDGQAALGEVVKILMQFKDRRFMVAGHTDNQPIIRNTAFKDNWYLSTARANSVVQYMIKQKFPARNLAAAGYGEFDPVARNDSDAGREQNRRIEIILVPNLEELPSLTGNQP
ncbi:MAG TPA: OmpA family protein [Kofleriaceae bacterium]|nr:OmpA family protein [Kofleriaceae bacterium]